MRDIVIIDYGLGNLHSVKCGPEHAGTVVTISSDQHAMHRADCVFLPGVGTRFHNEMREDPGLKMLENFVEMC